jgi:hypothetical protein
MREFEARKLDADQNLSEGRRKRCRRQCRRTGPQGSGICKINRHVRMRSACGDLSPPLMHRHELISKASAEQAEPRYPAFRDYTTGARNSAP